MPTRKLTEAQIAICIVPRRLRWPDRSSSVCWAKANDCVDAWQNVVRRVDLACAAIEEDLELSANAIARRLAEISDRTLTTLANFKLFEIAERALSENIDLLEKLSERDHEQVELLQISKKAREDLREGVEATKRMVQERTKQRECVSV